MRFEVIRQGMISEREANTPTAVAAGSRCAVTREGELVCTYAVQSALGVNDFTPLLSRSRDGGKTWTEQGLIWPHLGEKFSLFGSVSASPAGDLFFYGTRTPIDQPGESFWSDASKGLKPNELFWAKSTDGGKIWSDPAIIPMPIPGAAEAPGALCLTRTGRWLACYAPYNTFDPHLAVQTDQIVVLYSDDQGKNWGHSSMLRFPEPNSGGAEAWVIELNDGRLLGTCWHVDHTDRQEYPNPYALSLDRGETWRPHRSTGVMGQSTALAAMPDGRALMVYNQRKHGERGVWLAVVRPTESDSGIEANEIVWRAETVVQRGSSAGHSSWQDFSFGEPSVTVLRDGTLLVTLWCVQPSARGVRYVHLKLIE
jgi:BNR repeat protein